MGTRPRPRLGTLHQEGSTPDAGARRLQPPSGRGREAGAVLEVDGAILDDTGAATTDTAGGFVLAPAAQADEPLRRLARVVVAQTADTVVICDRAGRIVYVNPAFEQLTGYTRQEVLGQTPRLLKSGAHDPGFYAALWHTLLDGRAFRGVFVDRKKSGELYYVEQTISPVRGVEGAITHFVATGRDITARQRAEDALRFLAEAGQQLAGSLDHAATLEQVARLPVPFLADGCAVALCDEAGGCLPVVVAHRDPALEASARALWQHHLVPPAAPHGPLARVLRTGRPELVPVVTDAWLEAAAPDALARHRAAEVALRSLLLVPLVARGRTLGALALAAGLPGRYGPADLALAEDLARRAALALDNARLYRQAQEAVRMRDAVLATVSHDLRGPLQSVKGWTQVLQRRARALGLQADTQLAKGLAAIAAGAAHMAAQINELVDVARLQVGQTLALDRRPTDLVALTRQAVAERAQATQWHRFHFEPAVPSLVGCWDAARLQRVLDNLLSNAVKYSAEGGEVRVTVAPEEGETGAAWAVLAVADEGIGIPAADLPHVFAPFHRAANVAGKLPGTGLGLASVRQIVEHHGGTVAVTSQEGVGSTFTVRLPLAPPASGA